MVISSAIVKPASRNDISRRGAETNRAVPIPTAATTRAVTFAARGSECIGSGDHNADQRPQTTSAANMAAGTVATPLKTGRPLCESTSPAPITIATVARAAMPRGTTTSSGKNKRATRQRPASSQACNPASFFVGLADRSGARALPLASERPLTCTRERFRSPRRRKRSLAPRFRANQSRARNSPRSIQRSLYGSYRAPPWRGR